MGFRRGDILINTNDIVGKRLGRLLVIRYVGCQYDDTLGGPRLRHFYECKCDCGTIKMIQRNQLKNEIISSCGCLKGKRRR